MNRRQLLLSYSFPPDSAPEAYLAAKFVVHVSGRLDVVTVAPRLQRVDTTLMEYIARTTSDVHRVDGGSIVRSLGRSTTVQRFPDRFVVHNSAARRTASRLVRANSYSHLISWSQWHSIHLVAESLNRNAARGIPWVARMSDPWVDNPFVSYGRLTGALNRRWERAVIERAQAVLFTSEETRQLVMSKYPAPFASRTRVVPHSFDPDLYPPAAPPSGPTTVRYIGTLYGARRADPLVAGIERLARQRSHVLDDVRFEFFGRIPPTHQTSSPEAAVVYRPAVDYRSSLALMQSAHLLLVIDAPGRRSVFLPSKLIDYVGSGRPVLGITPPGPAARLIRELGGWVADPSEPDAVAAALQSALDFAQQRSARTWGDSNVRDRFHVHQVAKLYEEVLDEVS